jgi:predicted glycosyltransferase
VATDVLLYVQHLLGSGHLHRASLIGRAMADAGLDVDVVAGGPVEGVSFGAAEVHRLPAVRSLDAGFSALVDEYGRVIDDAFRARRRDLLLALFHRLEPRLLMIETFPLGRRQMRFELVPLLESAWRAVPRPLVVSSVRDILQRRSRPDREQEASNWVGRWFDRVLVHGDPAFATLDESFPAAAAFGDRLVYTGVVAAHGPAPATGRDDREGEILVSSGGGAVGRRLYEAALDSAAGPGRDWRWRLLVSAAVDAGTFRGLVAGAPAHVAVERNRADFRAMLGRCLASVSQAGYNTVADIVVAGARSVLVPFVGDGGETEQTMRAQRLERLGRAVMVSEGDLDGDRLAQAVRRSLAPPSLPPPPFRVDGAARTASLVRGWLEAAACAGEAGRSSDV